MFYTVDCDVTTGETNSDTNRAQFQAATLAAHTPSDKTKNGPVNYARSSSSPSPPP
tara:strand:- start:154 stop:321 length:168 start_codon:yes stop_codon:yes gene_type:complete